MASAGSRSESKKKIQKGINSRSAASQPDTPWWRTLLLGLLLVGATVALYSPVNHHLFVNYDDDGYVTDNSHVKAGLSEETIAWAFTSYDEANWHPLTWLSHALDYQLFELDPAGHHDINLLLHTLNVALLFWVLWRATGCPGRGLMVAALFALHPINVESVAWIAERKNLLSMLFFLLALSAYRWYARAPRVGSYSVIVLLYILGLMCKPQVITLPFVLLLWDYWPLRRMAVRGRDPATATEASPIFPEKSFAWLVKEKLPLLALSAASAVITMKAQGMNGGLNTGIPLSGRIGNAIVSYALYLGKAFWPRGLAPIYPHPGNSLGAWQITGALLLLGAITALVVSGRRRRYFLVGWLWFLGTLVPMIGLVQVGRQAMADRYAYLPFVGLFIMIAWGWGDGAKRAQVPVAWQAGVSVAALLALAGVTHRQIDFWGDNVRLWTHTLQVTNRNYLAEDSLGRALEAEGNRQDAILHYARSVEFDPSYVFAHIHVGTCLQLQGDLQGALQQYQEAISLTQKDIVPYAEVRHLIFANMASAYSGLGDFVRARESLESAVSLNPDSPEEWTNLGILALNTADADRAIVAFSQAIKIQPSQRGYQLLARALQRAGRPEEAQSAMQHAASFQ